MTNPTSLRTAALLALALTTGATARTRPLPPVAAPGTPRLVAEVVVTEAPSNYLPLSDGRLALLDNEGKRLRILAGSEVQADVVLHGEGFRADAANVVDLAEGDDGRLLVLDTLGGTVWRVAPSGEVEGHFGLFVGATRIARGADGRTYVRDAVNACVTAFDGEAAVASFPSRLETEPFATKDGRVPFRRLADDGLRAQVGVVVSRPREDAAPVGLQVVSAREGLQLHSSSVIGSRGDDLYVTVASWDPDRDQGPRSVELWVVSTTGAPLRRYRAPRLSNYCWDCGPEFRVGPDGDVWFFHLTGGHAHDHDGEDAPLVYRVYRMALEGGAE